MYSHLDVALDYQVNDFVSDSMATFSLWNTDCEENARGMSMWKARLWQAPSLGTALLPLRPGQPQYPSQC
jgi:hypothetical protein